MLVDGDGNKTRVGSRMDGDRKIRYSKVTGDEIPEKMKK